MRLHLSVLASIASLLMVTTAFATPAVLQPPTTGSMYNGNNVTPPRLEGSDKAKYETIDAADRSAPDQANGAAERGTQRRGGGAGAGPQGGNPSGGSAQAGNGSGAGTGSEAKGAEGLRNASGGQPSAATGATLGSGSAGTTSRAGGGN